MNRKLKDTIINKTTFQWVGHDSEFRLTGYYYIYNTSDGDRLFACVEKENANGVSGVGACGIILHTDDIKILSRVSVFKGTSNRQRMIESDKHRFEFLKSLPLGLTKKQVDDAIIENMLNSTTQRHRAKVLNNIINV